MRRPTKPRYPPLYRMHQALGALRVHVPTDAPITSHWRQSLQGTPNLRVIGTTHGDAWTVDVYSGNFYRVQIQNAASEVCRSIPEAVGYLRLRLNLNS